MPANLLLHVREPPHGRVIVTPVDFPRLSVDADTYEVALATVRGRLERQLREISGSWRTSLAAPVEAELDRVELAVRPRKDPTRKLRVTIGLVVTARDTGNGVTFVVHAPEVPFFTISVSDRDEVVRQARKELQTQVSGWQIDVLLASAEVGNVRLETITMPFPPPSESTSDDDDDEFSVEEAADDLVLLATERRIGRLNRRDSLVERVLAALSSTGRNSVMLVGSHDVGKSALVHEVAYRLTEGAVPPALAGRPLWRLSANELVAGARYIGMWQDRARLLVAAGRSRRVVFAMGEPTGIVDAGRWSGGDNNLGRYLRPYMESGELSLICEATPEEFKAALKKEPSFVNAFHRVDVPEPAEDAAREIVLDAARLLDERQAVTIADDAVACALELTRRYEPYRALPGKAVRLLEEVVQQTVTQDGSRRIDREEVAAGFATRTGLPLLLISDEVPLVRARVREFFEARVLGQDEAVEAVVDLITVAKAGLHDPRKPLGSYFFVGPTGVGKTELTKALAEYLFGSRDRVIRFDMAEYSSADAVQRLVGTAWDGEGELTSQVAEQPFCVVLLDEIEKAHASVFDALLSVLGEGRLTDANGQSADFRNAIVIMTSNLGATKRERSSVGFTAAGAQAEGERMRKHFVEQAEKFFRPEFFNRIDRVLAFRPLDADTVRLIARRDLGRLLMREGIVRRRLLVEIGDDVVDALATAGFHPRYGARPLEREIERRVIQPLARLIVEEKPAPGDLVRFACVGGEISVELQTVEVPEQPQPRRRPAATAATEETLARAARRAAALRDEIEEEDASPSVQALRTQHSALVERTGRPGFWDDNAEALRTLDRLYALERILERFDALRLRAEGLAEMGRQMGARRDRTRLAELRRAIVEIEEGLSACRLELAGTAAGGDETEVKLRVTPVAGASEWAQSVAAMYRAWAERTGREAKSSGGSALVLVIRGGSADTLLAGEAGLHRYTGPDDETVLARVSISVDGESEPGDDGAVVRVYSEGRRQLVRDPRTGARVGDVSAVLRGKIDEFLLATLRRRGA
jgi:ATP-dependent Clp protease ATP-binding subunit ClpA